MNTNASKLFPTGYDLRPPTPSELERLASDLTEEERHVLLHQGTEPPFCGTLLDNKKTGVYACRLCALPLFESAAKFDSGTGWPSFSRAIDEGHVHRLEDRSHGVVRTEIRCGRCDAHLGHVFSDGPPPTHERHCLNSISLEFYEQGRALPNKLGR